MNEIVMQDFNWTEFNKFSWPDDKEFVFDFANGERKLLTYGDFAQGDDVDRFGVTQYAPVRII